MEACPVCQSNLLVKSASIHGEETFCSKCRRIIVSSTLGFKFAEKEPEECKTADGRPGLKGPGKKAVCHPYSNDQEKEAARKKAMESLYSWEHKRSASKIINATPGFMGAPTSMMPPAGNPTKPLDFGARANPVPPTSTTNVSANTPLTGGDAGSMIPAAPGGVQPGNLNGPNPLNSGTTASKRIIELIKEASEEGLISEKEMGIPFCTKHGVYHQCKDDDSSL